MMMGKEMMITHQIMRQKKMRKMMQIWQEIKKCLQVIREQDKVRLFILNLKTNCIAI